MGSSGERLKKVRMEKGLSLEEAHKKTKIHLNILKAMEGDSLTELSPIYLKGFLKIYCRFLGVDPKDYVPDYQEPGRPAPFISHHIEPKEKIESRRSIFESAGSKLGALSGMLRKIQKPALLILAVVLAVSLLFNLGKAVSSRMGRAAKTPQARLTKAQKAAALKSAQQEVKPAAAKAAGIRLTIRMRQNCLLIVKADGRTIFKQVMEKGRSEAWQAKEKFEVFVANAAAAELEVNGQIFSNLGRKNQKLNILINDKGLSVK